MNRDDFVKAALDLVDLSANPSNDRARYISLVAPGETKGMGAEMAKMSGCALVVAGIWRAAGVKHPKLTTRYKLGDAVTRLLNIAYESKAWVHYQKEAIPGPGDMVLVGNNASGGTEHVYTVLNVTRLEENSEDGFQYEIDSVDGGQKDASGYQCIEIVRRRWEGNKDQRDGSTTTRLIQGWIDCTKLPHG